MTGSFIARARSNTAATESALPIAMGICNSDSVAKIEPIGQGRLTNDALIAVSAGRLGIPVITANWRDFSRLAEFRPFQGQVISL